MFKKKNYKKSNYKLLLIIVKRNIKKINDQLNFVQQKLTQLNQDEETYQERYHRLDESLRENETYKLKK